MDFMKNYRYCISLLVILFSFTSQLSVAQETSTDSLETTSQHSFAFHVGTRLTGFASKKSTYLYPYRLTYRHFDGLNALRIGGNIGYGLQRDNQLTDSIFTSHKGGHISYRLGVGYERYYSFEGRVSIYYGAEMSHYFRRDNHLFEGEGISNKSTNYSNHVGISPLFGVDVKLTKNISLSSEMMWFFGARILSTKTTINQGNNNSNITSNSVDSYHSFYLPRGIAIRYNF